MSFFRKLLGKKPPSRSDTELLQLYRQTQDMTHLGELYDRYLSMVLGTSMKYLKDEEESKDMVMQVFEKIAQKVLQIEIEKFDAWLYMVVKNECLLVLRKRQRHQNNIPIDHLLTKNSPKDEDDTMENPLFSHLTDNDADTLSKEEVLTLVEKAVEHLAPEQKVCIKLFYLQEKSYKEIVEQTGYDLNKVKSYLQNGKRNLKLFLQPKLD
jgi:RNA polymerase sigma-70 factor (ECF subfamily)